ncbi:MAG: hypothetical protein IPO92_09490 [Saprospiraceae bacterium]|nr:hypothetical protein [Saprospiraceae bacterium]
MNVVRYHSELKDDWDKFVRNSNTPLFIFERTFIEYHGDRYLDHSLLVYKNGLLVAVQPACEIDFQLISHRGLPFSDVITKLRKEWFDIDDIINAILNYCRIKNIKKIEITLCPNMYKNVSSEETTYFLRKNDFVFCNQKLSAIISLKDIVESKLNLKVSKVFFQKSEIVFNSNDFESFNNMISNNLNQKYQSKPVHSLNELVYLKEKFSDQIDLVLAKSNNVIVGAVLLFKLGQVIKCQYLTSTVNNASDFMISQIILKYRKDYFYFDLGTSNSIGENEINLKNLAFKCKLGGKAMCIDKYICVL